jgi:GNAT superfamily N-acetyltransferase
MEIEIQPITLRHAMAVQKLSQQLGYALFLNEVENNIKEVILSTDHIALVAVVDGEVAGWIHAFKAIFLESNPFVEVGGLVVDENYRSQGIGKKLVEQIKQWCTEQKISTLRVRSQVKRKEAHQFYLSNGFSEIKEQKVFQINL